MKRIVGKLSYSNVMATVAVFIALGGGAYAAVQLERNSVGTKHLKKNAVNGAKVRDGSLTGADFNVATLGPVPSAGRAVSAAHADTAGRADSASRADVAGHTSTAANSNALQGLSASAFLGATDQAADSALLEGREAREFGAVMSAQTLDLPAISDETILYGPVSGLAKADDLASVTLLAPNSPLFARGFTAESTQPVGAGNVLRVHLLVGGVPSGLGCNLSGASTLCIESGSEPFVNPATRMAIRITGESDGDEIPSMSLRTAFLMTP